MATEDLTTYDETDVTSDLTVVTDRVTADTMNRGAEVHLSDSKGAGFFSGDFVFRCTMTMTALDNGATYFILGVSNTQDSFQPIDDASGDEQTIEVFGRASSGSFWCIDLDGGAFNQSSELTNLADDGTVYYLEFERDESIGSYGNIKVTAWTVDYEDTLFGTVNLNLATSKKDFQYVYPIQNKESSGSQSASGYVELVDLDAGAPPGGLSMPVAMHHYTKNIGAD